MFKILFIASNTSPPLNALAAWRSFQIDLILQKLMMLYRHLLGAKEW